MNLFYIMDQISPMHPHGSHPADKCLTIDFLYIRFLCTPGIQKSGEFHLNCNKNHNMTDNAGTPKVGGRTLQERERDPR